MFRRGRCCAVDWMFSGNTRVKWRSGDVKTQQIISHNAARDGCERAVPAGLNAAAFRRPGSAFQASDLPAAPRLGPALGAGHLTASDCQREQNVIMS